MFDVLTVSKNYDNCCLRAHDFYLSEFDFRLIRPLILSQNVDLLYCMYFLLLFALFLAVYSLSPPSYFTHTHSMPCLCNVECSRRFHVLHHVNTFYNELT